MATIPAALRRPRLSRRAIATLLVGALGVPLVAGAGFIAFSSPSALGEMELLASYGEVTVLRGGEAIDVDKTFELEPNDVVQTGATGSAQFNLDGARNVVVAPASSVAVLSTTAFGVQEGSALATTAAVTRVAAGDIEVTAPSSDAMFRLDRRSSLRTGVYSGSVEVSAPGEPSLTIPRLHEASLAIAAPNVPLSATPYSLDAQDAWDGDHLREVIELDQSLTYTSKGLAAEFKKTPPISYFRAVAGPKVDFLKSYLDRRPADILVGLTVARGAAKSDSLGGAFHRTFDLRDRGASWGIAAAIMRAQPKALLAGLGDFIDKSGLTDSKNGTSAASALANSGSTGTGGPAGQDTTVATTTDGPSDDPTVNPTVDPTSTPTTNPSPSPSPTPTEEPPPPPKECTDPVDCFVDDVEPPVDNPLEEPGGGGGKGGGQSELDLPQLP